MMSNITKMKDIGAVLFGTLTIQDAIWAGGEEIRGFHYTKFLL